MSFIEYLDEAKMKVGNGGNFIIDGNEWTGTITKVLLDGYIVDISDDLIHDWESINGKGSAKGVKIKKFKDRV